MPKSPLIIRKSRQIIVKPSNLETLFSEIRRCDICLQSEKPLPHAPRPIVRGTQKARIRIIGQAPGTRVHASGIPFDDPSGDRLRDWLGVTKTQFYDEVCFPGLDSKGGDLPPRKECAPLWQDALTSALPGTALTLLVGLYAQKQYLGKTAHRNLTETVKHWRDYGPEILPLPHPSWRNNIWIKKHDWFLETLSDLKTRVAALID